MLECTSERARDDIPNPVEVAEWTLEGADGECGDSEQ